MAPSEAPPPPPPVVPVPGVDTARAGAAAAVARLEATIRRSAGLPDHTLQQRVDDEWSTVESLRHIVFVIDLWLSRAILGEPAPFHSIALPPSFMPPGLFPGSGIDPAATPTCDEAAEAALRRAAALADYVDSLTPGELARPVDGHAKTVAGAIAVILAELEAHDRFINRDLDRLAADAT